MAGHRAWRSMKWGPYARPACHAAANHGLGALILGGHAARGFPWIGCPWERRPMCWLSGGMEVRWARRHAAAFARRARSAGQGAARIVRRSNFAPRRAWAALEWVAIIWGSIKIAARGALAGQRLGAHRVESHKIVCITRFGHPRYGEP